MTFILTLNHNKISNKFCVRTNNDERKHSFAGSWSGGCAAGDIMFWFMLINARHNFISLQRTFHGWLAPVGRLAAHCACADQFPSRKTEKLCGDDCGPRKSAGGARRRGAANSAQECMTSWRHVAAAAQITRPDHLLLMSHSLVKKNEQ